MFSDIESKQKKKFLQNLIFNQQKFHLFNKISNVKAIISEEEINTDLKQFKKDEIDNIVNFILEKM